MEESPVVHSRFWRRCASLLGAVALVLSVVGPASATHNLPWGMPQSWFNGNIAVCFQHWEAVGNDGLWDYRAQHLSYLNALLGPVNTGFDFVDAGTCSDGGAEVNVYWVDGLGCGPIAQASPSTEIAKVQAGYADKMAIEIDKDCVDSYGADFFDYSPTAVDRYSMSFDSVLLHEMGHILGVNHSHDTQHLGLMDSPYASGSDPVAVEEYCSIAYGSDGAPYLGIVRDPFWGRKAVDIDRDTIDQLYANYTGDQGNRLDWPANLQCLKWNGTINGS